jgi:hypothetical protein
MAVRFQEYAVRSRSTSAESHESDMVQRASSGRVMPSLKTELPEYEYPVPFVVRNTFIETHVGRPTSLDEFFEERRIVSCPPTHPETEEYAAATPEAPQFLHRAITTGAQGIMNTLAEVTGFWAEPGQSISAGQMHDFTPLQPMPCVLVLSDILQGPVLGSSELPTVGSAGHNIGTCKPCAFFYNKGCENGQQCSFCHLCGPDEKRRRQKEKQAAFRDVRRERRQMRL